MRDAAASAGREPDGERAEGKDQKSEPDLTHRRVLAEHCGITDPADADEFAWAADHLLPDGKPKGGGWWRHITGVGDLPAVVADLRARLAAAVKPEFAPLADAHPFEPGRTPNVCRCGLPENNRHHQTAPAVAR